MSIKDNNQGSIILLVLIFGGIFTVLFTGTFGFIFTQHKFQVDKVARERAMQIAEAGVNYYRWFLSHYPDDLTDGTGGSGPYEHEYFDPEGGAIGKFNLDISGVERCGIFTAVDITSTGSTYESPNYERQIKVRHSRPSVAEYAYLLNANVWAGSDREIKGKYHSNGGIRMDGKNDSLITSALAEWQCTSSFGCDSTQTVDGVFGDGEGGAQGLWQFPVEQIDFAGLSLDFSQMKSLAQTHGVYFAPQNRGYHIIFKNDGTFDAYIVTDVGAVRGYVSGVGWDWDYHVIDDESFLGNYSVPADCGLIFVEDDLWIEGEVHGKISIISADLTTPNIDPTIILNGNITYSVLDGSDGLLVAAEQDVLIPLYSPDQMELRGIFLAQKGHFGRNHYSCNWWWYPDDCQKAKLKMVGSVVSNGRVGTKWTCGGNYCSGYENRENSYDRKLMTDPPPLTPFADDEFKFIKWEELE